MTTVDIDAEIPNNVDLAGDRRLQRALESWQPRFIDWWKQLGPVAFQDHDVYLRTAIAVGQDGWANFDYVQMPDYRWGIFLADPSADRRIGFGDHPASRPGRRCPASTEPTCAGWWSSRATPSRPRWSSSGLCA